MKRNPLFVQSARFGRRRRALVRRPPHFPLLLGGGRRRWRIPASVRAHHLQLGRRIPTADAASWKRGATPMNTDVDGTHGVLDGGGDRRRQRGRGDDTG
jgi:hypothetical protein